MYVYKYVGTKLMSGSVHCGSEATELIPVIYSPLRLVTSTSRIRVTSLYVFDRSPFVR